MEFFDGDLSNITLCDEQHDLQVFFCKEYPIEESYFLGYCSKCGLTIEIPIQKLEEAFQ